MKAKEKTALDTGLPLPEPGVKLNYGIQMKLEKIFQRLLKDEDLRMWKEVVNQTENFRTTLVYIERFFKHHPKDSYMPTHWHVISYTQDLLSLQDGIEYLRAFLNIGAEAFRASLRSQFENKELAEYVIDYEKTCQDVRKYITLSKMALEIFNRRGVSEETDMERLIAITPIGRFTKVTITDIIDREYHTLNSNFERKEFLEHLVAQLSPYNYTRYRSLLYQYMQLLLEVNNQIEREHIIATVNPKNNGSEILHKVTPFFDEGAINLVDEKEIRALGMRIIGCLAEKATDTEKSSAIKIFLEEYQDKDNIVSKVIYYWLKMEYDLLLDSSGIPPEPSEPYHPTETIFKQVIWTSSLTDLGLLINDLKQWGLIREKTTDDEIVADFLFEKKIGNGADKKKAVIRLKPRQIERARKRKTSGAHKPTKEMEDFQKTFGSKIAPK